jgi:acetyl esterase/lipase
MTDTSQHQEIEDLDGSIPIAADLGPIGLWHIGPRDLPLPSDVSDELRASIAATPQPDPEGPGVPDDADAVRALVAEMDSLATERVQALSARVGATITPDVIDGVGVFHVVPAKIDTQHQEHLFVYVHGGGFILNAGEAGTMEAIVIAHRLGIRAVSIDYRMAPDDPLPAPLDDVSTVYRELVGENSATSIALGGSSGGGNLCTVAVQDAIRDGVDVPGALFLGTPGNDMSDIGDTLYINRGIDRAIPGYEAYVNAARFHAGGRDLSDPMVSPVYGSFEGFPPTFLVTGTRDLLLSATVRTHAKIRSAGSVADLLVLEGVAHGDYGNPLDSPESRFTYAELGKFLLQHLQ